MSDLPILEQMEAELATRQETLSRARREIAESEEAIEILEPAIQGLRALGSGNGRGRATPAPRKPAKKGKGKPAAGGRAKKADWEKGLELWRAGNSVADIAKALGVSGAGVRFRAKADGWPAR